MEAPQNPNIHWFRSCFGSGYWRTCRAMRVRTHAGKYSPPRMSAGAGLVFGCFSEIHGDGHMRTAVASVVVYPLFFVAGHPGTRTLAFAGMEVSVEYSQETSVFVEYFISFYIGMIDRNFFIFFKCDAIQTGSQTEYTFLYLAQLKIRTQLFFIQIEFLIFSFLNNRPNPMASAGNHRLPFRVPMLQLLPLPLGRRGIGIQ